MLGIEDYGSGSDSDVDHDAVSPPIQTASKPSLPTTGATASSSKLSLPPPKSLKRGPKKISIGLPTLTAEDYVDDERPVAKKPRRETGAGASSLLSMLPAPKQKNPTLPQPERVLGGGTGRGLVFNTSHTSTITTHEPPVAATPASTSAADSTTPQDSTASSFAFLPPSLAKGRSNISVEEETRPTSRLPAKASTAPANDFFSLGATSTPAASSKPVAASSSSKLAISSAPVVPVFTPPEPTPEDEYPGYYRLPSGKWAAHDAAYFATFVKKWEKEYNAHVRALEKGMVKGFEGMETAGVEEVNAMHEMEKAKAEIQEREAKKAVTKDANPGPVAPKMNINAAKLGKQARSRHQLSSLLTEAYQNREALEERIAEGRRNRKESGNKYGF